MTIETLFRTLRNTTIFILNQTGWKYLLQASEKMLEGPKDLLEYGPRKIILTKGEEGCEVFSAGKKQEFPVQPQLRLKFKNIDPTGSGDSFSAGLIKGLLNDWSFERAVAYGQIAASITCSRKGTCNAFPTQDEIIFTAE